MEEVERQKESVLIASLRHVAEIRMAVTYLGRAWSLGILRFQGIQKRDTQHRDSASLTATMFSQKTQKCNNLDKVM